MTFRRIWFISSMTMILAGLMMAAGGAGASAQILLRSCSGKAAGADL